MAITLRPSATRGHANHGWLDTYHSFSFADYHDDAHMGFRDLRVINDDRVTPGAGFPTHGHRDMEIVTYITEGALGHKDSTGSEGILHRGDVQAMSAGRGVRHSEFNVSEKDGLRLLQIWIMPESAALAPAYAQKNFPDDIKQNQLRLLAGPDGRDGSLTIHQDARIYASLLDAGKDVTHKLSPGRGAWLQMVDGALELNGYVLKAGDGAAVEDVSELHISAKDKSEFLLFDLV